ncbi:hypothetical protein [Streptomyces griseomycini]|uniref:Uncharacterized protein n=1 Tax=Streptomyces griseomycini TaxID=66895 RepID=A0A7W7LZY6_9ACTN|nr:hypothetical protein [Streptomyces griseomycini]MBB4899412.1 hypothetical protein [Streptomyces griseomycini]
MSTGSYFEPIGERRYGPTAHASGAWDPTNGTSARWARGAA